MSRKFISPKDPLRHERQRVRDLERRLEHAETTSLDSPPRDGHDEVGAAHDVLEVVPSELDDAAKEVSFGSGTFDRDLYEAMCQVGSAGAVNGEVEVPDRLSSIAEHLRSWGYVVVSPLNSREGDHTGSDMEAAN